MKGQTECTITQIKLEAIQMKRKEEKSPQLTFEVLIISELPHLLRTEEGGMAKLISLRFINVLQFDILARKLASSGRTFSACVYLLKLKH